MVFDEWLHAVQNELLELCERVSPIEQTQQRKAMFVTDLAGRYCDQEGLGATAGDCSPGYYCPAGQSSATPGNYSCPQGSYCVGGLAVDQQCPSGTYQVSCNNHGLSGYQVNLS